MSANFPSNVGVYLTSEYEILRRIFSYLSILDLKNCLETCEEWKTVANLTLKARRRIQTFILDPDQEGPVLRSDATLTLLFSNVSGEIEEDKCVMSESVFDIFAYCGIIYFHENMKYLMKRHMLKPSKRNAAVVRFPPNDKVIIKTLEFGHEILNEEQMNSFINIPNDVPIKALMIIGYNNYQDGIDDIMQNIITLRACVSKRDPSYALAGCWLEHQNADNVLGMTVVLYAGQNLEASSCVLDNHCRTLDAVNTKVEEFSKKTTRLENSVLLMFRCYSRLKVRRRYNYHPTENVEVWEGNAIAKHFSSIPLVGCYGTGELGINYPDDEEPKKKKMSEPKVIEHQFSSILLYIGYKK